MNRNVTAFALGLFLFLRRRGAGAMIWSVFLLIVALLAAGSVPVSAAAPDTVLEWIGIMNTTVLAGGTNPLVSTRVVALVSASVFDAVNGIEPRFQPLHVKPAAPHNASQRAAAIQPPMSSWSICIPHKARHSRRNATHPLRRLPPQKRLNPSPPASPGDKPLRTPFGPGG